MRNGNHMGIGFALWNGPQGWFWYVVDPYRKGAAIGAAASEAEAIREARRSIEEWSARDRGETGPATIPAIDVFGGTGPVKEQACDRTPAETWNELLANLNRYLNRDCCRIA